MNSFASVNFQTSGEVESARLILSHEVPEETRVDTLVLDPDLHRSAIAISVPSSGSWEMKVKGKVVPAVALY